MALRTGSPDYMKNLQRERDAARAKLAQAEDELADMTLRFGQARDEVIRLEPALNEARAKLAEALRPMFCGHPPTAVYSADEGTNYCRWCEEVTRLNIEVKALQEVADAALDMRLADHVCAGPLMAKAAETLDDALRHLGEKKHENQ